MFVISMHLSVFFLLPYKKLGAWGLSLFWLLIDSVKMGRCHSSGLLLCLISVRVEILSILFDVH